MAVMFLDFQSLSYFPCEFVVNYGYCTGLIKHDFTRAVYAMQSHARFVEFFFLHVGTVLFEPSVDLFLGFPTIWGYATGARDLIYTEVAVFLEVLPYFSTKELSLDSYQI